MDIQSAQQTNRMINIPCLKQASPETLNNLHDHKYLGPAFDFIAALDDTEKIKRVLPLYKNVNESDWGLRYEKWRQQELEDNNPNSRKNLLKKLEELKRKKNDLLQKYKYSKKTCDELKVKVGNAKTAKAMRVDGQSLLKVLEEDVGEVEGRLSENRISFGPDKSASSSHLTLSFEVGNLVHLVAKRSSNLLGVSDLFIYDECPTDLSVLLKSYGLFPVLAILRRKMRAIYEHWSSSDYSSQDKLLEGACELLRQNPGIYSAQRIAFMPKSEILKLPTVGNSASMNPEPKCIELENALIQLNIIFEEILHRIGSRAREFDKTFVPQIPITIDALAYDALSFNREFTTMFQEFELLDYSKLLAVPALYRPHPEIATRPLVQCHEFVKNQMINSFLEQLARMLETVSKEDEQVAAKTLEMLLSNILVRLKNNLRMIEERYLIKLEEAGRILSSDIPDRLNSIKLLEQEKNRLYSAEFYQQISEFFKENNKRDQ